MPNRRTMRLLALFLLVLIGLAMLSGCNVGTERDARYGSNDPVAISFKLISAEGPVVRVYSDPLTGCHWIASQYGGIQPRLYSDGVQVCE